MRPTSFLLLCMIGSSFTGCSSPIPAGPRAPEMPKQLEMHGDVRLDEYYGMRDREDPQVIAYLEAENAYTKEQMAHTEALQGELFEELKGRVKQTDESVPYQDGEFYYYSRTIEGKEYSLHCRKSGSLDAPEQVMIDENALAVGNPGYFAVGSRTVSPSGKLLAYAIDTVGRRFYKLHFANLELGEVRLDTIPDVTGNLVWANDNRTVFYTKQDPITLRSFQVWRHVLGTPVRDDVLIFEEADDTFGVRVQRTKSDRFLLISSSHTLSSEVRYLEADDPLGEFQVFLPRERGHEYRLDHLGDHFYLRTNDAAENFRLIRTPVTATGRENWEEVIPHRPDVLLQGIEIFEDYLVVNERQNGLVQLRIRPWDGAEEHLLDFGEPAYSVRPRNNRELETTLLRYSYSSMTTPNSVYDYDLATREKTLLKRDVILGEFAPEDYRTERLQATTTDGVQVPISLVYRVDQRRDGGNPLLLSGYGSYGSSSDASFRPDRLSLVDRGFVCAIAHVRGGQELGRSWYEDGKLLKKVNTFTDFIACADHLVAEGYAQPDRVFARGGSAGGLLMGAVVNLRPELWRGVIAAVPFVDVVTTMLDDSIPLTTSEFDEWGDPKDPVYYEYMLSYSPYDHVEAKDYPNLLVTTGLHDSQVQYWEPAKWVARLRTRKTDDHLLLLRTNMAAGHGGPTGRYRRYRETAFAYAFLLDLAR